MTLPSLSLFLLLLFNAQLDQVPTYSLHATNTLQAGPSRLSTPFAKALTCHCDSNDCTNSSCRTDGAPESACFAYFEKTYNQTGKNWYIETQFGCLSSNGTIAHLQCLKLPDKSPQFMGCCRDKDHCNADISPPISMAKDQDVADTSFFNELLNEFSQLKINLAQIVFFGLIFCSIFIVICILSCVSNAMPIFFANTKKKNNIFAHQSSTKSQYSEDSSFLKLNHQQFNHNSVTNSTPTTASLSDLHKDIPVGTNALTDNSKQLDLTSGRGRDKFISQWEPAHEIANGPMDFVGQGRYGKVYRSYFYGEEVAVKAFRTIDEEAWRREEYIYCNLKISHCNIVNHIVSTLARKNQTEYWMIMEYCPYGSLYDFLNNPANIINEIQASQIIFSVVKGLSYLHEYHGIGDTLRKPRIAHRDIKSKNILMRTPNTCCLADFGHAAVETQVGRSMDFGRYRYDFKVGTIRYMAPEMLSGLPKIEDDIFKTFEKADIYQFGLVVWEVVQRTNYPPYHCNPNYCLPYWNQVPPDPKVEDMIEPVCKRQVRPPIYDFWSKNPILSRLSELMPECWRPQASSRLEAFSVKIRLKEICDDIDKRRSIL